MPETKAPSLPTFSDVRNAARRVRDVVNQTPVLTSRTANRQTGAEIFFKCENFQRTGAFKLRGAYNALSRLPEVQRTQGVLAYSSGNHAQAIALAGRLLDIPTTILMPEDAPQVKLNATRGYGAEVVTYDRATEVREEMADQMAEEQNLTLIPPYDHPHIVAGQGTAAMELFEEAGELDLLLVPCGGGGLLSGSALAARGLAPDCRVIGVEPERADDAVRSFRTGTLQTVENPDTIADGARTPSLGSVTFPLVLEHVDDMVGAPEEAIRRAMYFLWQRMKLVVEPTGALGASAILEGLLTAKHQRVGIILSGGNVDLQRAAELFEGLE